MAGPDAYQLLASELAAHRELTYHELIELIGPPTYRIVRASDGTEYATQTTVRWRYCEEGDILVVGWVAVHDCGMMRRYDDYFIVHKPELP
jgi:hypothetical protein